MTKEFDRSVGFHTHYISKAVQIQHMVLLDGRMRLMVTVARGV